MCAKKQANFVLWLTIQLRFKEERKTDRYRQREKRLSQTTKYNKRARTWYYRELEGRGKGPGSGGGGGRGF